MRAIAPASVIYVLNGLMPGTAQAFADDYLRPVINSTTELAEWDAFVAANNWRGGAALHVDTGMNRLGVTLDEAVAIAPRIQSENHGIHAADEPSRLRRDPRSSDERQADPAVP